MTNTDNAFLMTRWFHEVWNQRRVDVVDELIHADAVGHLEHQDLYGRAAIMGLRSRMLDAVPDIGFSVERVVSDGDQVVARWLARGTHGGELAGLAPTQKKIELKGTTWARVRDGKFAEVWVSWNLTYVVKELLEQALSGIDILKGIVPICAQCKMVRRDDGGWEQVESYVSKRSLADFSHGLCPGCVKELYPDDRD